MIPIKPVNVTNITEAIVTMLTNAQGPHLSAARVTRDDELNEIPGLCPWIGVYRMGVSYPSRVLGLGSGFRGQRIELAVFCQHSDATSGEQCGERLEELIVEVISTLLSDPTLNKSVDTVDNFEVRYIDYARDDAGYFQTAAVYLTAVTMVHV
jgi:hypothetical protein